MKQSGLLIMVFLGLSSLVSLAAAGTTFIGLGGSYNAVHTDINASGTLDAVSGFPPNGVFSAAPGSYHYTRHNAAPEVQLGYVQPFNGKWLWGVKFLYQYLQSDLSKNNVSVNYIGPSYTNDRITAGLLQSNVKHELVPLAMIGYSFMNGFVYLGAGSSLFGTQNNVNNINDTLSGYYIGKLGNFSGQTNWQWGGAVQAGVMYSVNSAWLVEVSYLYARTGWYGYKNAAYFSPATSGGLNTGTISFNTSKRITAQALVVSVNKLFPAG